MRLILSFAALSLFAAALAVPAQAATVLFSDRASFLAAVGTSFTDSYEADLGYPGPATVLTDAAMSAVVGETRYEATGLADNNLILGVAGNATYCSGCQGSFTLHFDATSFGTAQGVFGVALDIVANAIRPASAFITFGDGSSTLLLLGNGGTPGITSDKLIRSISIGVDGGPSDDGFFIMDNLTIASAAAVPEPATWAMLVIGFGLVGAHQRRRAATLRMVTT